MGLASEIDEQDLAKRISKILGSNRFILPKEQTMMLEQIMSLIREFVNGSNFQKPF